MTLVAISVFLIQTVILSLLCCLWTAHSMGVHDASPLLWHKEDSNPLQVGGVYGMDVMTILYAILSCTSVYRCLQRKPVASVKNVVAAWLDDWYLVNKFAEMSIKLLFVFDGHELGLREPEGNKDVGRR